MDRIELRRFLESEQAEAAKWRADAERALKEVEALHEEFGEYVLSVGKSNLNDEEKLHFKEVRQLVKEAREELIFFDGVKKGIDAMAKQIRDRLAMEELANAGRWVPKPNKPRRR